MKPFNIGNLHIAVPIVQGGMGVGVSLAGLSSAVANMGGIGTISSVAIGLTNPSATGSYKKRNIDTLREEIRKARKLTRGVLGVNIMTVITNFQDMVRTSIEEGIDIIFSGAGLPLDLPKYLDNQKKTKLIPIVSSARAASIICKKWLQNYNYIPDGFVVEGPEAGGHLGFKAEDIGKKEQKLEKLVTDVLEVTRKLEKDHSKNIPVIAAGGIYSGEDAYRFFQLGVSAVQLGTRFVATEECDASHDFKMAFVNAEQEDIRIIKSPVGLPGRTIYNKFLEEAEKGKRKPDICKHHCISSCNPDTTEFCIAEALKSAYEGKLSHGFAFTGASAAKVKKISKVSQVFKDFEAEYNKAKQTIFK